MSVGIITRPIKSGSNWNALGNPVVYKIQRQDHPFDQIADNGGFVQLRINGVDVTAYYQVGNTVYYDGAIFATTATITARSFTGGHTLITVDVAYVSTDVGIINNLSKRTDYHVQYSFNSVADVELLEAELTVSPGNDGMMSLSASVLKNLLTPSWSMPETVNEPDTGISLGFYLVTQEYYDGALQGSEANDDANPIYGLLGANQIGYAHGSNMLSYFPADENRDWLTKFKLNSVTNGLKMWRDWPFTLSFIKNAELGDLILQRFGYNVANEVIEASQSEIDHEAGEGNIQRVLPGTVWGDDVVKVELKLAAEPEFPADYTEPIQIPDSSFDAGIAPGFWANIGGGVAFSGTGVGQIDATLSNGQTTRKAQILVTDYAFDYTGDDGGFLFIEIAGVDVTSFFEVGDIVYILSNTPGSYDTQATITNSTFTTDTIIKLNIPSGSIGDTGVVTNLSKASFQLGMKLMKVDVILTVTGTPTFFITVFFGNAQVGISTNTAGTGSSQTVSIQCFFNGLIDSESNTFSFSISQVSGAGSGDYEVTSIAVTEAIPVDILDPIMITLEDVCDYDLNNAAIPYKNPILLNWHNSAGGDAWWMFPLYHEVSHTTRDKKAKRIILFADDLDPVQWEAINELNSLNEVYSPPIIDLENTNTINSTSKQVGKQVYMVNADGDTTGVIVIPSSNRIDARDVGHRIAIEIELPEIIEA